MIFLMTALLTGCQDPKKEEESKNEDTILNQEVYKEKSFSKAAENLYISQPALSAMIKKVEAKVGMPLFDRSTTPIQLTDCGKKYIKTAEKIMDLEDEFAYYVGNMHELKTGHLSLGGSYLFSSFSFPPLIEQFRQAYPNVKVSLFEGHTPLLEQKLFAGELDIIIDNSQHGRSHRWMQAFD